MDPMNIFQMTNTYPPIVGGARAVCVDESPAVEKESGSFPYIRRDSLLPIMNMFKKTKLPIGVLPRQA